MVLGQVLVEYDNEDWTTREWLRIHDGSFKIFLVEKTMVWSQRPDPSNPRRPLLWPALVTNLIIFFLPWLLIVGSLTMSSWPVVSQLCITICAIIVEWLPTLYKTWCHTMQEQVMLKIQYLIQNNTNVCTVLYCRLHYLSCWATLLSCRQ